MFQESDAILNKIINAKILDAHDIATIERALKMQEIYEILLDESLGVSKEPKIFNLEYQVGQAFGCKSLGKPGFCKDCSNCIKQTILGSNGNKKIIKVTYMCSRQARDTQEYNSCEFFK